MTYYNQEIMYTLYPYESPVSQGQYITVYLLPSQGLSVTSVG